MINLDYPQFLLHMSAFFCEYSLWDSFLFYTCYTQTQKHCQMAPQNSCMNLHSSSKNMISLTTNISASLSYYYYCFLATLEIVKFLILLIWEVSLVSCFTLDFFNYEWYWSLIVLTLNYLFISFAHISIGLFAFFLLNFRISLYFVIINMCVSSVVCLFWYFLASRSVSLFLYFLHKYFYLFLFFSCLGHPFSIWNLFGYSFTFFPNG